MMQDLRDMIAMGLAPDDARRLAARILEASEDPAEALAAAWQFGATMALNAARGLPVCRICGCWEHEACDGGCWWVEGDLCSSCSPPGTDLAIALPAFEVSTKGRQPLPSMRDIAAKVAELHGLTVEDLRGDSQRHHVAHARHEAFFLCWLERHFKGSPGRSLPAIGAFFHRDHTTVLYGIRAFAWRHQRAVVAGEAVRFPEGLAYLVELLATAHRPARGRQLAGATVLALPSPSPRSPHADRAA